MMPAPNTGPVRSDSREAQRFLDFIAEGDEQIAFQTFDDRENGTALAKVLIGTFDEHAAELARLNGRGAGIFFTVNYTDGRGRKAENITGIRALFVDLDGAPIAPVMSCGLQAHAIIESSPGRFHAYWLISGCELADFTPLQRALAAKFDGDRTVIDLPRVMRLPGFVHRKAAPFVSRIVEINAMQPYPVTAVIERLGLKRPQGRDRPAGDGAVPVFAQGGRNAALAKVAGRLRRQGLPAAAIQAALLKTNEQQCKPPLPDDEVRRIAASISRYPAGEPVQLDQWPEPLIPGTVQTPPIPAAVLPDYLADMARAVAASTQTAEASATMLVLPMIAAAVQRRFVVAPHGDDDYTEPLAIWVLIALVSGARKTPILTALSDPLRHWEKLRRDALRPEIARRQAAIAVAKKRIEKLQIDASKADDRNTRRRIEDEIQAEIEHMPEELRAPRLLTGDVTPERLQQLLAEYEEKITLLSDEAGIFSVMSGIYSGGAMHLDAFLQAWSGSSVRVDRAGRLAHLDKPALSFGLALQPGVLADVANVKRFHDAGLLARFVFAIPDSISTSIKHS